MKETIIASSALILCVILLRRLCRERVSACFQYALWLIVAVRLIMPGIALVFPNILPESEWSIMNTAYKIETIYKEDTYIQSKEAKAYSAVSDESEIRLIGNLSKEGEIKEISDAKYGISDFLVKLWYLGIAVTVGWMISVNVIFMHRLRKERIRYEKEKFELPESLPVYMLKSQQSPCLYGMPGHLAIYLPESLIDDGDKVKHILAHEYCHFRHRDVFWSALRCVIVAVYWFNPLIWLAAVLSKQDCELACDETAIRILGEEERVAYGKTLVSLIMRKTVASDIVCTATTMTGGTEGVKERVRRIVGKPKRLIIVLISVIAVACAAVVMTFTHAKPYPSGADILESENSVTVTTDCFYAAFPEEFSKNVYYRGENDTDIIICHRASDREVGRLCRLTYEEAAQLSDETREVTLIGSYGLNDALGLYMNGIKEADDSILNLHISSGNVVDIPSATVVEHHYYGNEKAENAYTHPASDTNAVGVAGTDSNNGETEIPQREEGQIDNDETHILTEDNIDTESVYLPNESIDVTYTPASVTDEYCYVYVSADNSDADAQTKEELSEMNKTLVELSGYIRVLSPK